MYKFIFVSIVFMSFLAVSSLEAQPYKNKKLNSTVRTLDLISRMTLAEKVGQLLCPMGWEMYDKNEQSVTESALFRKTLKEKNIGMLWATFRADPWTQKTIENGLNPALAAQTANALQGYVLKNTRLGIPIFLAEECPHGHMAIGTTVFPTGIGLAASFDTDLLQQVGSVIAKELRLQGGHIAYGPVIDLVRDPRWSRVEETFGEDPLLGATLASAMVQGYGAGVLSRPYSAIATLKHFAAYGIPEGGINGNPTILGQRELMEMFLPPFKSALEAGARSIMTSYNSIDGIPSSANHYLLTEVLRNQWKFKGFTVSDLYSIDGLKSSHYVAKTLQDAAMMSLKAGVDVDLGANAYPTLIAAVQNHQIPVSYIDSAVFRVLKLKFDMGLFENPFVDAQRAQQEVNNDGAIALARRAAQKSIVLLKNKDHILPLREMQKIALIGPNADNMYNMLGDYTAPQTRKSVVTLLSALKAKNLQVEYVKGCAIRDTLNTNIPEAVAAAQRADVAVVVVGGSSARDFKTNYLPTGAATVAPENRSDMESGEGFDRATFALLGKQLDLLKAIKATGKPLVVVYIQGRPIDMNWANAQADALLTAWYPGMQGGNAIADVLLGEVNPAGRLPISIPQNMGQIPVYYNKKNPVAHDYVELSAKPLFAFGYGLSYSQFVYSDLQIEKQVNQSYKVSFGVQNIGEMDGEDVPQLYLRDEYASVVRPIKQLLNYERIFLQKGQSKRLSFVVSRAQFSLINAENQSVVEPGTFTLMLGHSSDDIVLKGTLDVE